ncbi:MAG: hypothetical protein Mars2KO_29670 [Maribacter sp.]
MSEEYREMGNDILKPKILEFNIETTAVEVRLGMQNDIYLSCELIT